ncbi:MAG: M3 family oligoendopeptidase, partial [Shimia sp.]
MIPLSPRPTFDADAAAGGAAPFGDLPEWDFSALYTGPDAPEIERDFAWLEEECAAFAADHEGKLAGLDAAGMLAAVHRYERIDMVGGRLMSYFGLRYYQATTDAARAKAMADAQDRMTHATTPLVFWSLEVNRLDDDHVAGLFAANDDLARYGPVFERMRAMKPHQLSDELQRFLHDQSTVGAAAWNRLFDEHMAGLEFEVDGEVRGLESTLNLLSERDRATREAAARALAAEFQDNVKIFARIHNTLAKEKEIEDRWRKMPTPQTGRHLSNHVEPEVVQALRDAVVAGYPRLSHRYYALKAKWMGLEKLQVWDRNAPLPMEETRIVGWDEARRTVMDAYAGFDPRMAEIAK